MSGIIADGTSGIVNIVLFRALETVHNHTKGSHIHICMTRLTVEDRWRRGHRAARQAGQAAGQASCPTSKKPHEDTRGTGSKAQCPWQRAPWSPDLQQI